VDRLPGRHAESLPATSKATLRVAAGASRSGPAPRSRPLDAERLRREYCRQLAVHPIQEVQVEGGGDAGAIVIGGFHPLCGLSERRYDGEVSVRAEGRREGAQQARGGRRREVSDG
jgi:hypothetical protein